MSLSALKYYGGKTYRTLHGRWIASMLPGDTRMLYAEPYAGMLGILLQRAPSKAEIVNDLNGRIVNWWRVVRDHPNELARMMRYTPNSEAEYRHALKLLDTGTDIERANNLTTVILRSMVHSDGAGGATDGRYIVSYASQSNNTEYWRRIDALSDRLRRVQILCRPASKIIERIGRESQSIMYIDPPYMYADTSVYHVARDERDYLFDLLPRCAGKVAISGYGDEWDELDWYRHTMETQWMGIGTHYGSEPRTEVLWTNYRTTENRRLI